MSPCRCDLAVWVLHRGLRPWGPVSSEGTVILGRPQKGRTGDRALSGLKQKQPAHCVPSFQEGKSHLEQLLNVYNPSIQ